MKQSFIKIQGEWCPVKMAGWDDEGNIQHVSLYHEEAFKTFVHEPGTEYREETFKGSVLFYKDLNAADIR